jgi:hypothetical protein
MKKSNLSLLSCAVITFGLSALLACRPSVSNLNTNTQAGATPSATATSSNVPFAARAQNPCWVHIWEDENFQDNNDVIYGPGKWNNMRGLPGANKADWGDEIDSLKVGPGATVTVWEDENFGDNSQTYGPGTEKTNLRGDPDMGDQIDSIEIKCK